MTASEATKLMAYLKAMYPRESVGDDTVAGYCDALREIPLVEAMAAARMHVATSPYFPRVSEIIRPIADARAQLEPAEQAWVEVTRAISRWGRYRPWVFGNPAIDAAVEAIGKDQICNSENLGIERAHFLKIYESYRQRELTAARTAPLLGREYVPMRERRLAAAPAGDLVQIAAKKAEEVE